MKSFADFCLHALDIYSGDPTDWNPTQMLSFGILSVLSMKYNMSDTDIQELSWKEFCEMLGYEIRTFSENNVQEVLEKAFQNIRPPVWDESKPVAEREEHLEWICRYNRMYETMTVVMRENNERFVSSFNNSERGRAFYLQRIGSIYAEEALARIPSARMRGASA